MFLKDLWYFQCERKLYSDNKRIIFSWYNACSPYRHTLPLISLLHSCCLSTGSFVQDVFRWGKTFSFLHPPPLFFFTYVSSWMLIFNLWFQDFSLVSDDDQSLNLKSIHKEIEKLKVQLFQLLHHNPVTLNTNSCEHVFECPQATYEDLLREKKLLDDARNSNIMFTQEFQQRANTMKKRLEDQNNTQAKAVKKEQVRKKEKNIQSVNVQNIILLWLQEFHMMTNIMFRRYSTHSFQKWKILILLADERFIYMECESKI